MIIFMNVFNKISSIGRNNPITILKYVSSFLLVWSIIATIILKLLEPIAWIESAWQVWQTITTVGYGNAPATTTLGRIWTMIYGTIGIMSLPILFTYIFNAIQYNIQQIKEGKVKNPDKNGYIIFGYNEGMVRKFVEEIRITEKNVAICIVDNKLDVLPNDITDQKNVWFVKGGGLDKNSYEMSAMAESKAVIVLPKDNDSDSDGTTKAIVSNVLHYVSKSTQVIHVLVDQKNSWMFDGYRSVQVLGDIEILAIVQECQDKFSAVITEKLLMNSKGANPNTVQVSHLKSITWEEFNIKARKKAKELGITINILALIQDDKPNSCPDPVTLIEKGDYISIISNNRFDWNQLETAIANG